jgi:hypothetical protein
MTTTTKKKKQREREANADAKNLAQMANLRLERLWLMDEMQWYNRKLVQAGGEL